MPQTAPDGDKATGRILLVRLSALGDVAQCLPALASLRAARPQAQIGWLVEDRNAALLRDHPHVDRLFVFERRRVAGGRVGALATLRRKLREFAPEVAVDLQGNLKGALLTRLSGAPRRISLPAGEAREGAHLWATERPQPGPPGEHRAARALRLLAPLGAGIAAEPAFPDPGQERVHRLHEALGGCGARPGGYALLVPGTSTFGAFKRWPPDRFGALAQRLAAEGAGPVLVGCGPGEDEIADAVIAASRGAAARAPATADLCELLVLLRDARLVVGADSGPVVLASLLGTPTVALFGPKDPSVYAPPGPRTEVVWKQVYCSPCTLRRCGDPICMTTMEVDEVWPAVTRLLDTG